MQTPSPDVPVKLGDLRERIARRWPVMLGSLVVVLAVAVAIAGMFPERYTATTTLVVAPIVSDPSSSAAAQATININTEREILGSPEVARRASEAIGETFSVDSVLLTSSDVAAPSGSQVLQVSVSDSDPDQAAAYANALGQAYLEFRRQGATDTAARYIQAIDQQIAELEASADPAVTQAILATLREQRTTLSLFGQEPGRIIGPAIPPTDPSSLSFSVFLAAGLVGGLLVGVGLVLLRDRVDRKIRFAARLAEITRSEPVIIRSVADHESFRWLMREIDTIVRNRARGPELIGVVVPDMAHHAEFTAALGRAAEDAGRSVVHIAAERIDSRSVDRGWPTTQDQHEWGGSTVLIDASAVTSRATLARLAERCAVIVLAGHRHTRVARVRDRLAVLQDAVQRPVITAFVARRRLGRALAPSEQLPVAPPVDAGPSEQAPSPAPATPSRPRTPSVPASPSAGSTPPADAGTPAGGRTSGAPARPAKRPARPSPRPRPAAAKPAPEENEAT